MSLEGQLPIVTITVVAYNSDQCLRRCLLSVRDLVLDGLAQLIVVDNASPDDCAQIVSREFPEAVLVRSEINRGFAGGCNLAWPFVRSKYWFLLNPDVVVPPEGINHLASWMDQHPEIGAASPGLVDSTGRVRSAARRFPSLSGAFLELFRLHRLMPTARRADRLLGAYWTGTADHLNVDWVPGTAMIVRREAVQAAGLLSENVPMYGEDTEWCWRIRRAGWRVGVRAELQFRHDEGHSAIRTWGEVERSVRMWRGLYASCASMRGRTYSRLLMATTALAFAIEAYHPRRSMEERGRSRMHLQVHAALLRERRRRGVAHVAEGSIVR